MRGLLSLSCAAFIAAAIVIAAPQPASALPAAASALTKTPTDAGLVQDVGKRWYRRGYYRPYRYRRYGYRPYYGGWGYRPYYRPYYGYGGWGYPYWRRPGVNIWLGF